MLIRIVKMEFLPEHVQTFENIFTEAQPKIGAMPGCTGVQLLKGTDNPNVYFTYSTWQNAEALENYRTSELFITTWRKTKVLFAQKAEAWSTVNIK